MCRRSNSARGAIQSPPAHPHRGMICRRIAGTVGLVARVKCEPRAAGPYGRATDLAHAPDKRRKGSRSARLAIQSQWPCSSARPKSTSAPGNWRNASAISRTSLLRMQPRQTKWCRGSTKARFRYRAPTSKHDVRPTSKRLACQASSRSTPAPGNSQARRASAIAWHAAPDRRSWIKPEGFATCQIPYLAIRAAIQAGKRLFVVPIAQVCAGQCADQTAAGPAPNAGCASINPRRGRACTACHPHRNARKCPPRALSFICDCSIPRLR